MVSLGAAVWEARDARLGAERARTEAAKAKQTAAFLSEMLTSIDPDRAKTMDRSLIRLMLDWLARYPIASIEDGLAEGDWPGWESLTSAIGSRCQLVGDDVFVATSDGPQVYTVKKYSIEHLAKKPIDYRDKTIAKIKEADIASVDITAGAPQHLRFHLIERSRELAGRVGMRGGRQSGE